MDGQQWLQILGVWLIQKMAGKMPMRAMAIVGDAQAMKWAMAYMSGKTPKMDHDGWA